MGAERCGGRGAARCALLVTLVVWLVTTCPALSALLVALCGHLMATWVALHGAGRCWVCAADGAAGGASDAAEGAAGRAVRAPGGHVGGCRWWCTDADRWTLVGRCWAALLALLGARYALDGFVGDHVAMWRSGSGLALAGAALRDPLL